MLKFLQSVSIFKNLSTEQIAYLYKLLDQKEYKKGDMIIEEGTVDKNLYLIYEGSVEVLKKGDTGDLVPLAYLAPGEYFGEFSLIDSKPRSANVKAFDDTTLILLSVVKYHEFCLKFPGIETAMLRQFLLDIVFKLRESNETTASRFLM